MAKGKSTMENQGFITEQEYEEIKANALVKCKHRIALAEQKRAQEYREIDPSNRYGARPSHIESRYKIECVNALTEQSRTVVPALSRVR